MTRAAYFLIQCSKNDIVYIFFSIQHTIAPAQYTYYINSKYMYKNILCIVRDQLMGIVDVEYLLTNEDYISLACIILCWELSLSMSCYAVLLQLFTLILCRIQ